MSSTAPRLSHNDYTVACICPMGVELAAMEAMLDEIHQSLPSRRDQNIYTVGRIGVHNVVIAVMPEIGNNRAASVATQLLNDFQSIRFGLLVGIGGGIPDGGDNDIRLGDVVVSKPTATFGGVVQYDMGKVKDGELFEPTGSLRGPPALLRVSVQRLQAQHARTGSQIPRYLKEMLEKNPNMVETQYVHQGPENDLLFEAGYPHQGPGTCTQCDSRRKIQRAPRANNNPRIHYGTIGSANTVIKSSVTRDILKERLGILCVEMEAAGLMDDFPCLVIRGICDYADSHKNKRWQPYGSRRPGGVCEGTSIDDTCQRNSGSSDSSAIASNAT
jgi:nucleoside phosphorylase